jgi:Spy/CpxP family protein refolding chaperone
VKSMRFEFGPRTRAAALLTLVGVLGVLIGIGIDRALISRAYARSAPDGVEAVETGPMRMRRGVGSHPWFPGPPGRMPGVRFSQQMAEVLELTPEQKAAIDSIMEQNRVRVRALAREYGPRFRAIVDETRQQVESVLTAEQRARMHEIQGRRRRATGRGAPPAEREHNRGGGAAPDGVSS